MATYLMHTTTVPCAGLWESQECGLAYAKRLAARRDHNGCPLLGSSIWHPSTARILTTLLEVPISVCRASVSPRPGDSLLCFKLRHSRPENAILTLEEINAIGYKFFFMEMIASSRGEFIRGLDQSRQWQRPDIDSRDFMGGHRD